MIFRCLRVLALASVSFHSPSVTLRAGPRMATLHSGLQSRILCEGIEAGAVLVDVGEVAVAEDAGFGMGFLQTAEQAQ